MNRRHLIYIQHHSPPSDPYTTSKSDSNSYHSKPTLFTSPSIPIGVAPPNTCSAHHFGYPFFEPIGPGPSGPLATAHTIVGPLPTSGGPTLATMVPTILTFMDGELALLQRFWLFLPF